MLYIERCDQADVSECDGHHAFSIMLIGNACQDYLDVLERQNLTLSEPELTIKSRFMTPERTRALLREWKSVSLASILTSNMRKSLLLSLELFTERLSDIQASLPPEYRNRTILCNKLLNAVKDIDACKPAYHKSADTV